MKKEINGKQGIRIIVFVFVMGALIVFAASEISLRQKDESAQKTEEHIEETDDSILKSDDDVEKIDSSSENDDTKEIDLNISEEDTEVLSENDMTDNDLEVSPYSLISYYLREREERYTIYAEDNKALSDSQIVLDVNMDLDYEFYSHISNPQNVSSLFILCNKYSQLPSDFLPRGLIDIPSDYHLNDGKVYKLDEEALKSYIEMSEAAKKDGINLKIISAHRTYAYQAGLYNRYVDKHGKDEADRFSARPGHSEHETGLAIDLNEISKSFEDTKAFSWLDKNAQLYGYILRYPSGMEHRTGYLYEPWHYRYVGKETAIIIKDENLLFDEYYAKYELPNLEEYSL